MSVCRTESGEHDVCGREQEALHWGDRPAPAGFSASAGPRTEAPVTSHVLGTRQCESTLLWRPLYLALYHSSARPSHENHRKDTAAEGLPGMYCICVLFVLSSHRNGSMQIEAEGTDTVADLKQKIQETQGHGVDSQKLIYSGA